MYIKHNLSRLRIYKRWHGMMQRCYYKNGTNYKSYGEKGIKVCKRWHDVENFYADMSHEFLLHSTKHGGRQTSLDRIDGTKGYSKENCRWATRTVQARNQLNSHYLTYKGKTLHVKEWEEKTGIRSEVINQRIRRGWKTTRILETVSRKRTTKFKG